jgi:anti-sigma regulatory factor (Ser/Thr protein kinase)
MAPSPRPLELSLAATPGAPAHARAAVSEWLAQASNDPLFITTTLLLVSELVTNRVRHARIDAGQPPRFCGWLRDTTLRLELWDAGAHDTITARPPRRDEGTGTLPGSVGNGREAYEDQARRLAIVR